MKPPFRATLAAAGARTRVRQGVAVRCAVALCAFVLTACAGYYPTWHYAPRSELHVLHVTGGGASTSADPDARMGAELIGILRPVDGGPRRIHARFNVDDCGKQEILFKTAQTRAVPNGGAAIAVSENSGDVAVAPGSQRSIELFFDLPDPSALSNQALEQLDLEWTVEIGGAPHTSKATFRRVGYADPGPYYYWYGGWYGGPYWYGPGYAYDPWYWNYGYAGHCGYGWH